MRHIRDPVSGKCLVCESGKAPHGHSHGPTSNAPGNAGDPSSQPMWDDVRKKIIYVNAFSSSKPKRQGSPTPRRGSPPPKDYDNDPNRGGTGASASQVQFHPRGPGAAVAPVIIPAGGGGNTYFVDRGGSNNYYMDNRSDRSPPPRYESPQPNKRAPSPQRKGNLRNSKDPEYGYTNRYRSRGGKSQAAFHDGRTHQGASWGRRRCCTLCWALLILLLLAALAVGLYFLITYLQDRKRANAPENTDPNGVYINGVYLVQSTANPQQVYFVYGVDTPCNEFNNNTVGDDNVTNPNCNTVTTSIAPSNYSTTTPAPVLIQTTATASDVTSCLLSLLASMLSFYFVSFVSNM